MLERLYMQLLINILFLKTCLTIYTQLEAILDVSIAVQEPLTRLFESHCCSQELDGCLNNVVKIWTFSNGNHPPVDLVERKVTMGTPLIKT